MTLREAIEEVKRYGEDDWTAEEIKLDYSWKPSDAIATILNAVVKGELRAEEKQDPYWTTY